MKKVTKIWLVDDHPIVRRGLKDVIERLGAYKVEKEYNNGRELLDAMATDIAPDVIILDLSMPEMDGLATMQQINTLKPASKILIFTFEHNEALIIKLFSLGVRGYLHKDCSLNELKQALQDVTETGYYHSEILIDALKHTTEAPPAKKEAGPVEKMTEREKEFLRWVCNPEEYTYEQIADKMGVHRGTVDGYRASLFDKFSIRSKTGLVLFAIKYGVITI